jgi:hypothetical protein
MTRAQRFWSLALLLAGTLVLVPTAAWALVDAEGVPFRPTASVSSTGANVTVRWRITSETVTPPIVSNEGVYTALPSFTSLGTNPVRLSTPGSPDTNIETKIVVENLRIPQRVLRQARALGSSAIRYRRSWVDAGGGGFDADEAAVEISLTGSLAGPVEIGFYQLEFDDQSTLRVVQNGEQFTAHALIDYTGTGIIRAVWEISDPARSRAPHANTGFRTLDRVRQRFAGGGRTRLYTRPLPSVAPGTYYLRLRFLEPDMGDVLPPIQYTVLGKAAPGRGGPPAPLDLDEPRHMARVNDDVEFEWDKVKGARAYVLELFSRGEARAQSARPEEALRPNDAESELKERSRAPDVLGEHVTGAVVPADRHDTKLTAPMKAALAPGGRYLWRMRALSEDGAVIAESPLREVVFGEDAKLGTAVPPETEPGTGEKP